MKAFVAALLLSCAAFPATAKTLVVNVVGHRIDASGKHRQFTGLLIDDDGKVLSTLTKGQREPSLGEGDFRLDAKGRVLIPGLIEGHGHLVGLGLALRQPNLSQTSSLDGALALLAEANLLPKQWLLGSGWDEERWQLGRLPTAEDLDTVVSDHPAWIANHDGSAGWANSLALEKAGITSDTKDPPGGQIVRDQTGKPTGILTGAAMGLVMPHITPASAGERELALEAALRQLKQLGVTSFHDMGTTAADWALFRAFGDEGRLTIRINGYADGMEAMEAISPLRPTRWLYSDRLRLTGVKIRADGTLRGRGAYLLAPYADAKGHSGVQVHGDTRFKNLISRTNFLGYQAAVHAIGDAANRELLEAYSEIVPSYGPEFRNRVEHMRIIDEADLPRFKELDLVASVQPIRTAADLQMAKLRLGEERLQVSFAGPQTWAELQAQGVVLAFGSDTPVGAPNPFLGLHAALTIPQAAGEKKLTVDDALRAFTSGAATAGHMDGMVGSLGKGEWADFLLLDRDPFAIPPEELKDVRVLETWLAGKPLFVAEEVQETED